MASMTSVCLGLAGRDQLLDAAGRASQFGAPVWSRPGFNVWHSPRVNPRRASPYQAGAGPRCAAPDPLKSTCRILVVDDEATIRDVISDALQLEGYPVATASNGLEALAIVGRELPSVVLLDMRMPQMDGWAFARELQARGMTVPIIVLTAAHSAKRWADEIGAPAYLAKPFDLNDLLAMVERFCRET
jgi:CheY-like chemotaxis protein